MEGRISCIKKAKHASFHVKKEKSHFTMVKEHERLRVQVDGNLGSFNQINI